MHTLKVVAAGFALLVLCLVVGRMMGGSRPNEGLALGALAFIPLWLAGAGINLWLGVSRAGYTFAEEAPIFALVFGVPAVVALFVWWRFAR